MTDAFAEYVHTSPWKLQPCFARCTCTSGCQNCSDTALYQAFTCTPTSPWTDYLARHSGNNNSKHTDSRSPWIALHTVQKVFWMLGLYNKCISQLFNICSHWPDSPNRSRRTFQIGWDSDFSCAGVHKAAGKMHGKTKECNLPGCRNVISKASLLVDALKASQMKKVSLQIHPSTSHSTVSSTRHSTALKLISKKSFKKDANPGLKRVTLNWSSWFVPQFGHPWDPRSLAQLHVQQAFLQPKSEDFTVISGFFSWWNVPIFWGRVKGWERKKHHL